MAAPLMDTQSCRLFWEQAILKNLHFWQVYLTRHSNDMPALEQEWEGLIKGIFLGLKLEPGWPHVYELITALAGFMERRGYWDVWREVLSRALATAPQAGDAAGEVTLAALLARLSQRQGRYTEMIAGYRRVIRLARQQGDRFNEARACTNLGYFYIEHGRWQRAEVLCCYALLVFEQLDSDHGRAHTENHLGVLYTWQGWWAEAEQHLQRACAIWEAMEDSHGLMRGLTNLSTLCIHAQHPDEALIHSKKVLDQAHLTGEEAELGQIYLNMGLAYNLKHDYTWAETYTHQAETIFQRYTNIAGLADVQENLGVIYLAQQRWSEAIVYLQAALTNWRVLKHRHDELLTLIYLAEGEWQRNNQERANFWQKEAQKQLERYPQAGQYLQLQDRLNKMRQNLKEVAPS